MSVKIRYIANPFEENQFVESEHTVGKLISLMQDFCDLHKEKFPLLKQTRIYVEVLKQDSDCWEIILPGNWNEHYISDNSEVKIITAIREGGASGIISVIIGAVMIVAGFYTFGFTWAALPLVLGGMGMLAGGAASIFMKPPTPNFGALGPADDLATNSPTYSWEDQPNQTDTQLPVPIIYGEHRVAPHLINAFVDQQINMFWDREWADISTSNESISNWVNIFETSVEVTGIRFDVQNPNPVVDLNDYGGNNFDTGYSTQWYWQDPCELKIEYALVGSGSWTTWGTITIEGLMGSFTQNWGKTSHIQITELAAGTYKIRITNNTQTAGAESSQCWVSDTVQGFQKTALNREEDTQYLNLLYAVCEGEIASIDQIQINGTSIADLADPPTIFRRMGTNSQDPIPGFGEIRNYKNYGSGGGGQLMASEYPLTITTDGSSVNALIIHLKCPALFRLDKSTGNMYSNQVVIRIEYRTVGGAWSAPWDITIDSKSRSTVTRYFRIPSASYLAAGQYEVRVTKKSQDSTDINTVNDVLFMGIYEIQDKNLAYPNTALLGLRLKATGQLSGSLPKVTCLVRGKIFTVPWNVQSVWRDNPVDCFYDLLTNTRCGLGNYIDAANIDNDQLETEAIYCDATVEGQPRFKLDLVVDGASSALDLLTRIAMTCRGIPIYSQGTINFKIDKSTDTPVQVFSMGNIIADSLSITYLDKTSNPNVLEVRFANEEKNYEMDLVQIRDTATEASSTKERKKSVSLLGITRPAQAIRIGKYLYNSAVYIGKMISFKAMIDSVHCQPGDLIEFQHDVPQWGEGGRLALKADGNVFADRANAIWNNRVDMFWGDLTETITHTTTQIILDKYVSIASGTSYVVTLRLPDGTVETKAVDEEATTGGVYPWSGTIIKMASAFTATPLARTPYAFGEVDSESVTYRITRISRDDEFNVSIEALEFNSSVYGETGFATPMKSPSRSPDFFAPPPAVTELSLKELTSEPGITVSFSIPSPRLNFYEAEIQYAVEEEKFYHTAAKVKNAEVVLVKNLEPGLTYYFRVMSYSQRGVPCKNPPTASIYLSGNPFRPSDVKNLSIWGEDGAYFYLQDAIFIWSWDGTIHQKMVFDHFRVRISDTSGNILREENTKDAKYEYSFEKNKQDNGPRGRASFKIEVWAVNKYGHESNRPASLTVSNPAPMPITGLTSKPGFRAVEFSWEQSQEKDHLAYYVRTKVESNSWSAWEIVKTNSYIRVLTQAEVDNSGTDATIYIEVEDLDIFYQTSTAGSANADGEPIRQVDMSGAIFQITPSDSESSTTASLQTLYDAVVASGGITYTISGPEKWVQYEYPVEHIFNQILLWMDQTFNCYLAYSQDGDTWSYLKAEADHTLDANNKLLEASSKSDASTNYWTTGIANQPVKAKFTYMRQAKYLRLYILSTVSLYEMKPWTYVVADEIDAGTLHLAWGLTIASTEDSQNAVLLNTDGLKLYGSNVNTAWLKNDGTFWFGNASGANSINWNGTTLAIRGTLNADDISAGTITGRTLQTASSGKRFVVSISDNQAHFYGDRGDGSVVDLCSIGINSIGGDYAIIQVGTVQSSRYAIYANNDNDTYETIYVENAGNAPAIKAVGALKGVYGAGGTSVNDYGIYGTGWQGVEGSGNGYGVYGLSTDRGVGGAGTNYDFYANGAGTNYGPFTGAHDALYLKRDNNIDVGDILIDFSVIRKKNVSNTILQAKKSNIRHQKNVIGIMCIRLPINRDLPPSSLLLINGELCPDFDSIARRFDVVIINAVGEGQINVCKEGGDISAGDYICSSSIPGKGMRQNDDNGARDGVYRNYTVAKARENCSWKSNDNSIRQIACIYLSG